MSEREHPREEPKRPARIAPTITAGVVAAIIVTALVVWFGGSEVYGVLGNPEPGWLVRYGLNFLRLTATLSSAVCLGGLVFCTFFTSPEPGGGLSADGYAVARMAAVSGWSWAAASAMMVPFEMADTAGQPLAQVVAPQGFTGLLHALYEPKAWLVTTIVALATAVGSQVMLTWRPAMGLSVMAVFGLLPPAVVGHSSSNAGHDYATDAMVLHVIAAALWLGLLAAVTAKVRRSGPSEPVLSRYRTTALVCSVVLAGSGLVDAAVLVPIGELLSTPHGALVLVKVALLLVLCVLGHRIRIRTRQPLRLLSAEIALMTLTIGVSMGMAHVPPPNLLDRDVTSSEVILGYELPFPPTLWNLTTTWRFDLILGTAAVALAVFYLAGVRRLRRRGDVWPPGRTVAWVAGCVTVLVATSSGFGVYSAGVFSLHMLVHMVLNMLAPVLLVLGGPMTLALRALPPAGKDNPFGPREWVRTLLHSPVTRLLGHPGIASVLFVGSFYALYFTDLFESAMSEHWAHSLMNVHFLLVGYLYYWVVIGVDAAPKPLPHLARLGLVFAVMPFHAFFGIIVMSMETVIAENFYRTLDLSWAQDLLADQHLAGGIAWAAGEAPLVIVMLALLTQWHKSDMRQARRNDRTGDDDLAAYNAMLAKLAEQRPDNAGQRR